MQRYAVLGLDLLRWKIIRRNVCTAVGAIMTRGVRGSPLDCFAYEVSDGY